MRAWSLGAAAAALVVIGAACSSVVPGGVGQGAGGGAQRSTAAVRGGPPEARADQAEIGPVAASRLPTVGPAVIKTGYVRLTVPQDGFSEALQGAVDLAGSLGGFVQSTTTSQGTTRSGSVVIRVPASNFEKLLSGIKDLGKVRRESVSGQDVSQEFVDLEARLRNLRAQEAVLLRLMERAQTVVATIRVQGELQQVQLEIEQIRGRLRFLEDQTSLGTLTVSLVEAGAAPRPRSTLEEAWADALGGALAVVAVVIVAAGTVIPVAVLVLIGVLIFRQLRPRLTS